MDRNIILTTLAAAVLGIAGLWLLLSLNPPAEPPGPPQLPWNVTRSAGDHTQVFGLTLGESRLADLRALLADQGKLSLFVGADSGMTMEAFFDDIVLSGLRADWVASLQIPAAQLDAIYQRGLRITSLGDGKRRVSLAPEDAARLTEAPLHRLTYLPWKRLEPRDIAGNFGEPSERIAEKTGVQHWLYPDLGMDIARDPEGAVVIQYLNPKDFHTARTRLLQAASTAEEPEAPIELR
ncbi:hypothetical protein [Thiorhodovibrio frisius]|uniref:Uncharacterized protein n=1 Tax=Thiorhodovibrio frisius TaxID=631362 RepID=H8YYJ9_9GAMM|nr:hypothetical protein [Thiorhodovibrio frisius]EIC23525.1 hypothetical protein Thi970DRAFT_01196 [Thiorhodovibrio frisius]WPL23388.1 hypothetical protein Thiofri_03573 [Thiorhodovibrio frisius]